VTPGLPLRAWWLAAGLLVAAFLARGPLYLSVFPPFEGWDEYQHLAYIVHLDETGTIPAYDSRLPLALRPVVLAMPHSVSGSEQLREWGAASYADFWNAPPAARASVTSSPRLYQSQQPPLAYALALPVWRALKSPRPLDAIFAIRAINLLLVAGSLVLFAAALTRLVPAWGPRVAVLALVCLHPLFFQNVARVANDALAVATGIAGISLLCLADGRTLLSRGVLASACLAASVWSKQTSLTLIPALVLGLPLIGWAHGVPPGRLWRVTGVACAVLLLLVAPSWAWNYLQHGTILTTQDSMELAARGSTLPALATSFITMEWRPVIDFLFVPGKAWVGGWSFLPVQPALDFLYRWYWTLLLAGSAVGGLVALRRRARPAEAAALAVCATVVIFTVLGMAYHAVLSHAAFGRAMTTPWYFMTALPFLFVLVVRGLESIDRRLATAAAAALAVLFVAIDLHGTWVRMPEAYTAIANTALQWSRLSKIHPAVLSGDLRWWFLAAQLASLCLVAVAAIAAPARGARSSGSRSLWSSPRRWVAARAAALRPRWSRSGP
jgi:hypothetical protein